MDVLSLFNFCPEAISYSSNNLVSLRHSTKFALQNKRLSSAKNRWLNFGPFLDVGTPVITHVLSALLNIELSASAHKRNR
jgi:hypothetical protein